MKYMSYFLLALTLTSTPLVAMNDEFWIQETKEMLFQDDYSIQDQANGLIQESMREIARVCTTPLGVLEAIRLLISNELHIDILIKGLAGKSIGDIVDKNGRTALHWAVAREDILSTNILLALPEAKYLVLVKEGIHGDIPLHVAIQRRQPAIIKQLLGDFDELGQLYAKNNHGYTPWDCATSWTNYFFISGASSREIQDMIKPFLSIEHQVEMDAEHDEYLESFAARTLGCSIQ